VRVSYGRAVLWGAVAAIVAIAAVAGFVVVTGGGRSPMATRGERLMVVVASAASDGSQVAQLIAIVDASKNPAAIQLVDPLTSVTLPGTSYSRLRDAYSFGGGAGVAQAYARSRNARAVPFVTVTQEGLVAIVKRLGGVTVDVPADTNVFDGTRLFTFKAGSRKLDGPLVVALVSSAEYLKKPSDQAVLRGRVATAMVDALRVRTPDLSDLLASGAISSSLTRSDLAPLIGNLHLGPGRAVVTTLAP
jgi:hypothetical protein